VHLDHAGGVGLLMRELPRAHAAGAPARRQRHLIDPSALYESALAVYGARGDGALLRQLHPVAAERVRTTPTA
jgi:hypothetical protein